MLINQQGHDMAYGDDAVTADAVQLFEQAFGEGIAVLFVPNGTGANILSLKLLMSQPGDAAFAAQSSHIYEMESGALAIQTGAQLYTVPQTDGKLSVASLQAELENRRNRSLHAARPAMVTIANATELGTYYTADEVRSIASFCHENGMFLHLDGCRLPNAAVAQGLDLRQASRDLGVDVLSFGGAKNGMMNAETVIIFDAPDHDIVSLRRLQKQALLLVSKQRYLAGQFIPYLGDGIWQENATVANRMAAKLADGLRRLGDSGVDVHVTRPVDTNQVFCKMSEPLKQALRDARHHFYDFVVPGEVRFIASFDNTEADVEGLVEVLANASDHSLQTAEV
jgi:threonine aldolase